MTLCGNYLKKVRLFYFTFFLQLCRSFINYFQDPLAICHRPPGVPGLHFDNRSDKLSDDNGKYAEIMLNSDN